MFENHVNCNNLYHRTLLKNILSIPAAQSALANLGVRKISKGDWHCFLVKSQPKV